MICRHPSVTVALVQSLVGSWVSGAGCVGHSSATLEYGPVAANRSIRDLILFLCPLTHRLRCLLVRAMDKWNASVG